ncbi:MAG: bifunctional adenosylcobinamide kinase/adenosylcobinamide-phosphate guanylyltransferase [Synergistaceae bacterium]|nr:bifunctional adenosylcobinamide kinase/adenosylcobinamide-phosphate guanylyltransferase [Synergistaceae bacterium]MBQ6909581.1 bifunctional adenosylcobinamide kinase/adenosylcobinamide-phosphate guanylyltransferase [Synergistaceae bacterium]MBQ9897193.1 bifunctional adenosylcobinamide kinase/adenosylcobinamide-phosphate guanylyltransferase [Synergistaceae bacterium]MBR0096550.1 bifunctional adenosylcobinamide kinase/adenosylcobinamide-phosphate guanylyltransferase [Synergistaceae bacterium]
MHLIIGGQHMGKRAFAESLYKDLKFLDLGEPDNLENLLNNFAYIKEEELCGKNLLSKNNFAHIKEEEDFKFNAAFNIHLAVRNLLERGQDALSLFNLIKNFKVIICDEIGAGVVPLDKFERRWRDETGLLYQALVREADRVDRVWAGLALRLK